MLQSRPLTSRVIGLALAVVAALGAQFGFQATWTSNDTDPTAFALNGTPCH